MTTPKKQGMVTIQSPMKGWARGAYVTGHGSEGPEGSYSNSYNIDPFTYNIFGHISTGRTYSAITDAGVRATALPTGIALTTSGEAFSCLSNARLVRFGIGDDAIDANYDITLAAGHSAHTAVATSNDNDIFTYIDASGVEYVIWSWEDANDADVAQIKIDGTGQNDDWFSTLTSSGVLTKSVPHRIWMGPNNVIYITNGQYIASHDPSGTTGDVDTFNLGKGWVGVAGTTYGNYSAIVARSATNYITGYARGRTRLYLWNSESPTADYIYDLQDNNVNAVYVHNGNLYIFTGGMGNEGSIKMLNGGKIQTIWNYTSAYYSGPSNNNCVDSTQNRLYFANSVNAYICALDGDAFHTVSSTGASVIGFFKELSSGNTYIGTTNSTNPVTYSIRKISSTYNPGQLTTRLYHLPLKSTIRKVKVYFSEFPTGHDCWISLWKNYNTVSIGGATDLMNKVVNSTNYPNVHTDKSATIDVNIPNVNTFYMNFLFNNGTTKSAVTSIQRVEVYYETEDKY